MGKKQKPDDGAGKMSKEQLVILEWEQKLATAEAMKNPQAAGSIRRIIDHLKKKREGTTPSPS